MQRQLSALGTWLTKIESWLALGGMVMGTSAFTWLGHQWDVLAAQGWAAVIIVAVLCASALIRSVSLAYLAVSRFRAPRTPLRDAVRTHSQEKDRGAITTQSTEDSTPLLQVRGRLFANEVVPLDGRSYIGCRTIEAAWEVSHKFDFLKFPIIMGDGKEIKVGIQFADD